MASAVRHDLVLVGGGHAHVQVLRRWAMAPVPGVRLTVVVDRPVAVYSGMVPGFVAGQYRRHELEIDVRPLARRAGARFVASPAVGVDAERGRLELAGRPPLAFDTASFDVGSGVAGRELPGVARHALATRPIGRFVARVEAEIARARGRRGLRAVVVGAGAGGVELACALRERLRREGVAEASVTLLDAGPRVLPEAPAALSARAARALRERGVELRLPARVASVEADALGLADGDRLPADLAVWVTGGAALPLFRDSLLPTDPEGFVRVRPTLQVEGHDALFAVGDCARFEPPLPKAGVYAVRQGPVLDSNLRARLRGRRLRPYRPQRDFLTLLNLGDGRALGAKWGRSAAGRPVFLLKDWIDRRFVRRFQVLEPDGAPTPAFPPMPGMGPDEMPCGGCAAKLGEPDLARALARLGDRPDPSVVLGLAGRDDAAAVRTPGGEVVAATVDGFRAFADDPWLVGRAAAVNAASDLYAKGVAPRWALAQVAVPEDEPARAAETLYQVLAGARAFLDPAGVSLVGGHTTSGDEVAVSLAVFAPAPEPDGLLRVGGLQPGDRLLLTKPLGTGVLFAADMRGLARGEWMEAAVTSLLRPNAEAARAAREARASACTDVSGFGLAGHLLAMLRASKAAARLDTASIPALPGARELLARGVRSSFHPENRRFESEIESRNAALPEILFDPQTSGGLLFGVAPERAEAALAALRAGGDVAAAEIGVVVEARPGGPPLVADPAAPSVTGK